MAPLLAKILWSILETIVTKRVVSEVVVQGCRWFSDETSNVYDDKVVDAMAEALGVDSVALKVKMQEGEK